MRLNQTERYTVGVRAPNTLPVLPIQNKNLLCYIQKILIENTGIQTMEDMTELT